MKEGGKEKRFMTAGRRGNHRLQGEDGERRRMKSIRERCFLLLPSLLTIEMSSSSRQKLSALS